MEKAIQIIEKHLGKYNNKPLIVQILLGNILHDGLSFYKKMTDEEADAIIEKLNEPKEEEGNVIHIKVTTKELDIDIMNCKRELAKECSVSDILDVIAFINRRSNDSLREYQENTNHLISLILSNLKNIDDGSGEDYRNATEEDIYSLLGMTEERFTEVTGSKLRIYS